MNMGMPQPLVLTIEPYLNGMSKDELVLPVIRTVAENRAGRKPPMTINAVAVKAVCE